MELKPGALNYNNDAAAIAQLQAATGAASSTIVPVEGGTYTIAPTDKTINVVNAKPVTDLLAITVNLPAAPRVGQRLFFHCDHQIASVTFQMPGGAVDNWLVMLSPGDSVDFTCNELNNWARGV